MKPPPPCRKVARNYCQDAQDYLFRFDLAWDSTFHTKHRRIRTCIDLRFSYECLLKALIAYKIPEEMSYAEVLIEVVNKGHGIVALQSAATPTPTGFECLLPSCSEEFNLLPVQLRYSVESDILISYGENFYNDTLRSDQWVFQARNQINNAINAMSHLLASHSSGIVHASEVELALESEPITRKQLQDACKWWKPRD